MMEPWGLELEEKGQEVVIRAEVPGFEASELDVQLTGNLLTLRAEHKEVPVKEGEPVKRPYGRLERTLTLPEGIVPEKVTACYRNGVLEVHVPKTPEAQLLRIEVKT
jgi:HSP20 family protein